MFLPRKRGPTLTAIGIGRGCRVVVGSHRVPEVTGQRTARAAGVRPKTHVTYSLSVLVVRVSGVLPMRPMRTSFAKSDAEGREDANA